jgi:hypothetical protein
MESKKTLVVILNYNTPELTNRLYEQMSPFGGDCSDVFVLDNGSDESGKSKYQSVNIPDNRYFGGGLNVAFQIILENKDKYDSLLFMNSDLIVNGYNFVKSLRDVLFDGSGYKLLSPAIIQPYKEQCHWPTMHNWGSNVIRDVKWIDFQCPMIHIDLITEINQYGDDLKFGFGNDVYSGVVCSDNGWKVGVLDWVTAIHLKNQTIISNSSDPIIKDYNKYAMDGMIKFFNDMGLKDTLNEFRRSASTYNYTKQ